MLVTRKLPWLILPILALANSAVAAEAGVSARIRIDATQRPPAAADLPFPVGGVDPAGRVLSANNRYLLRDGRPWFPVMGEFHYARYPEAEWEDEILKMKAGGIQIISTYVFWIYHEEVADTFDWSGQRNLRRFVELCAQHGLYVWMRVGPWAHGEVRNGGLPNWVGASRRNAPRYLADAQQFFAEIGRQLQGQFWQDGGPIIGLQLENEYNVNSGSGTGVEHIAALRSLADEAGLRAPFHTLTAWDGAAIPGTGYLPVYSGYPDGFWDRALSERPPTSQYFFTPLCCDETIDSELRSTTPERERFLDQFPFFTAEMAGGMAIAYHRRPVMLGADISALVVSKLGSGVTLYGYYMYHGGTNPDGKLTTLQESQATGYWNDVTVKSYDFQAPLREFGQTGAAYRDLKALHLFLAEFGEQLAPMGSVIGEPSPESKLDTKTARVAGRFDGERGFLFLNNYQRTYPLPDRQDFQVRVELPSGSLNIPSQPVTIPSGLHTIWPVNLDLDGVMLEYATAQPVTRLAEPSTYVFFAWPGVDPEFSFPKQAGLDIEAPGARVTHESGRVLVRGIVPGTDAAIRLRQRHGQAVKIVVLSREQARNLWRADLQGQSRLLLSSGDLFFEGERVHIHSPDPRIEVGISPPLKRRVAGFERSGRDGIFERHTGRVRVPRLSLNVQKVRDADVPAPVQLGSRGVAAPPPDEAFAKAAIWSVQVPARVARQWATRPPARYLLRVTYQGDIARLYAGERWITDDFYKGTPWEIGLWRATPDELARGLELRILPLRRDAPIYLAAGARPEFSARGDAVKLQSVEVLSDHAAVMDLSR